MTRPGVPGWGRRRLVSGSVVALGLLDVVLVVMRHPLLEIGPIHNAFAYSVIHGSRYVLLASALALLASAQGLLHGKRHAWHIAVLATAASLAAHSFKRADAIGMPATAGVLVLLLVSRSSFPARSDPARSRQGLAWLLLGEPGVLAYGVAGLYLLDTDFKEPNDLVESLGQGLRLLFLQPLSAIEPVTRHGRWFVSSVRVMALLVLGVSFWHFLHPVIHRLRAGSHEREEVERLLSEHATTSLASFHLLDDKSYFFSDDRRAFIGYHVASGVAVALGEPIGEPRSCVQAAREFAQHCELNGWAFCFHQVTEQGAQLLREAGMTALKIGEEAIIPVREFALSGKSFRHLRNAVNRLERDGYRSELLAHPIAEADLDQLEEVSDAWLANGNHRERSFTLGAFSRGYMARSEVLAVRSAKGRIEAFANLVPSYRGTSGNFDLMRRRPEAPEGAMDCLFVALINLFRERGHTGMNLGFAPLANIDGSGLVERALRLLYERGNQVFNFRGLRTFKEKWHPEWEPRYLCYRSELQLLQLVLAIARVGEGGALRNGLGSIPGFARKPAA